MYALSSQSMNNDNLPSSFTYLTDIKLTVRALVSKVSIIDVNIITSRSRNEKLKNLMPLGTFMYLLRGPFTRSNGYVLT